MKSGSLFNGSLNTLNNSEQRKHPSASNKQSTYNCADGYSDRDSVASSTRGKRTRSRIIPMKASKMMSKKTKTMDYTNYAYNEAVGRLKLMLADSYAPSKSSSYLRNINDDSDNFSDNLSVTERPVMSEISKYLSPSYKTPRSSYRKYKSFQPSSTSKENLPSTTHYTPTPIQDYMVSSAPPTTEIVQAPAEIFNFIEKQEDYIEQLEKESKFCRNELSNLLGKVKDVISENEALTDNARSELAAMGEKLSGSSESEDNVRYLKSPKKREKPSPRYSGGPSIVYESKISELEAELTQANIDNRKLRSENDELKRKMSLGSGITGVSSLNCDAHRKQIENLQMDKVALEETIRQLQKTIDEVKSSNLYGPSKRYVNDLVQMERSQSELEVKHLRDELDRQHERVRELQHEMARRLADERANAERRYNNQVDQLGGDLSTQWDQVTRLQLDLERQKRLESDMKRDLSQRNAQIDELKMELKSNRSTFLADIAQVSAEKQSLEQEITSLRLQLDRSERQGKVEANRLTAEITSLRQRLDRDDADLLHSKREVLRLNDEIANLEKELAYGEMKNEIRPTKKDLDKRISEIQDKHADTVVELEEMIQSQKQLMDKLTTECKSLTKKLEDTTLKHKTEISALQSNVEYLTNRVINNDRIGKTDTTPTAYNSLPPATSASLEYKPSYSTDSRAPLDSGIISSPTAQKPSPYSYESSLNLGKATEDLITNESKNPYIEPRTPSNYESTLGTYDYGDDENRKDSLGEGEKHRSGTDDLSTNDYINKSPLGDQSTKPLATNSSSKYEKDDYQIGEQPSQPYTTTESSNPETDYTADYSAYDNYDQQPYTGTSYDPSYDTQYDGGQTYEGTTLNQYDGGQQQYDTNQYGDYGAQEYDQPYQSQYESTLPTTDIKKSPEIEQPELPKSSPPLPASTSAGITPVTGSRPTTESRPQPRPSNSTVGPAGTGTTPGGSTNNKLPQSLPQQSTASAKGLSSGRKD